MKYLGIAICVTILLLYTGFFFWNVIKKNSENDDATSGEPLDTDEYFSADEYELTDEKVQKRVTVVGQTCSARVKMVNSKTRKSVNEFLIYFKDKDGNVFPISVPEDLYDGFEDGQKGTLTLVNGKLFGFELD